MSVCLYAVKRQKSIKLAELVYLTPARYDHAKVHGRLERCRGEILKSLGPGVLVSLSIGGVRKIYNEYMMGGGRVGYFNKIYFILYSGYYWKISFVFWLFLSA